MTTMDKGALEWFISRRSDGEVSWVVWVDDNAGAGKYKLAHGIAKSLNKAKSEVCVAVVEYITLKRRSP